MLPAGNLEDVLDPSRGRRGTSWDSFGSERFRYTVPAKTKKNNVVRNPGKHPGDSQNASMMLQEAILVKQEAVLGLSWAVLGLCWIVLDLLSWIVFGLF